MCAWGLTCVMDAATTSNICHGTWICLSRSDILTSWSHARQKLRGMVYTSKSWTCLEPYDQNTTWVGLLRRKGEDIPVLSSFDRDQWIGGAWTHSIPSRSSHLLRDTLHCSGWKHITPNGTFSTRLLTDLVEKMQSVSNGPGHIARTLYCDAGIFKHDVKPNHLLCMIQHPCDVQLQWLVYAARLFQPLCFSHWLFVIRNGRNADAASARNISIRARSSSVLQCLYCPQTFYWNYASLWGTHASCSGWDESPQILEVVQPALSFCVCEVLLSRATECVSKLLILKSIGFGVTISL